MLRVRSRSSWVGFSNQLKLYRIQSLCTKRENGGNKGENGGNKGENGGNKGEKTKSSIAHYNETYKKLDNLDFATAAKILFTEPPRKKKFGFDFHVVQFIIACLPSVAVYWVAQYARYRMKLMDAELEEKKKKEDEKKEKEEAEQKALEEEVAAKSQEELMEMKERLGKIEETIKEIVITKTQEDQSTKFRSKEESKPSKEQVEDQKGNAQKPGENQANVKSDKSS